MKSKSFTWLWIFGIPLIITLAAAAPTGGDLLLTLALPFTEAGEILRKLSLSGAAGNAAALGLYGMLCVSPLLLLRKGDGWRKNGLLILACGVLFWVMWYMVNPGMMPVQMQNQVGRAIYACAVYSVMLAWGVLKLMDQANQAIEKEIYRALRIFLIVCAVQMAIQGLGFGFSAYRQAMENVNTGNTALTDSQLMPTYMFLTLRFCLNVLEHLIVVWSLVQTVKLLWALEEDPYSEKCQKLSGDIFAWCRKAIPLTAVSSMILNLGQVFLARWLVNVSVTLHIPAVSVGMTFAVMALIRLLGEGKALKDDNDLFI